MAFSLGLAAMTLTANNLTAQSGGGLFGRGEADAGNRAGEVNLLGNLSNNGFGSLTNGDVSNDGFGNVVNGGITNDGFGTPLGGGLLVMTAAAAGYAMLRRKKPGDTEI